MGDESIRETEENTVNINDCREALHLYKRSRWWIARKTCPKTHLVVLFMLDFCRRMPFWSKIDFWIIEFIVVEAASNFKQENFVHHKLEPTTAAVVQKKLRRMVKDLLRRTFETISSGFFMKPVHGWNHWNPVVHNPWDEEVINIIENLSDEDRDNITTSAQVSLGLILSGRVYEVLGLPSYCQKMMELEPDESTPAVQEQIVQVKRDSIKPSSKESSAMYGYVIFVEEKLVHVLDVLSKQHKSPAASQPMMLSAHLVGFFGEGLQLRGDRDVEFVVLCSQPPTLAFVTQVAKLLDAHLKDVWFKKFTVESYPEQALVLVKATSPNCYLKTSVVFKIYLTSKSYNALRLENLATTPSADGAGDQGVQESGTPNIKDCIRALDLYYRHKWFRSVKTCWKPNNVIRIMRDFCRRSPLWSKIDFWVVEFIVAEAASFAPTDLSLLELLRRTFERIATGFLRKTGDQWSPAGINNPWEKHGIDVTGNLSTEDREKITASALDTLSLIENGNLYEVLHFAYEFPDTSVICNASDGTIVTTGTKRSREES